MRRHKRANAWALLLGAALVLFVSFACILCEAGHECREGSCRACEHIVYLKTVLQGFLFMPLAGILFFGAPWRARAVSGGEKGRGAVGSTLVRWKVRLNN